MAKTCLHNLNKLRFENCIPYHASKSNCRSRDRTYQIIVRSGLHPCALAFIVPAVCNLEDILQPETLNTEPSSMQLGVDQNQIDDVPSATSGYFGTEFGSLGCMAKGYIIGVIQELYRAL